MFRKFLTFFSVLLTLISCNQEGKTSGEKTIDTIVTVEVDTLVDSTSDKLAEVIYAFVEAYKSKSNEKVNRLISPDLGLKVIYRPGVSDAFTHVKAFDFSNPIPSFYGYETVKNNAPKLTYSKLPSFDCGTEKWSKKGMFCDTLKHPTQLSDIAMFEKEFEPGKYSSAEIKAIKEAESTSYRVIVTTEHPLVFHVQKYKDVWYVTVLDRAYAGCDA